MGLGLAAVLYERQWSTAVFILVWLALPFVVLSLVESPRPFEERYVIFVPPMALLLSARGVAVVGQVVAALPFRRIPEGARSAATAVAGVGVALLFLTPVRAYYVSNGASDRLELTLSVVENHARRADIVLVSPRFFVRSLDVDGADVLYLFEHLSPAELDGLSSRYERMWILYTSYLPPPELQETLDQWVQEDLEDWERVQIKAITALAFRHLTPLDDEARLLELIGILEELAENSAGRHEAWLRHGALADVYLELCDLHDSRGEVTLANGCRQQAKEIRAAAPQP
jgi:hypothetical protein